MAEERNARIIEYKQLFPNISYRELAKIFQVSLGTIGSIPELKAPTLNQIYPFLAPKKPNKELTSDIGKLNTQSLHLI